MFPPSAGTTRNTQCSRGLRLRQFQRLQWRVDGGTLLAIVISKMYIGVAFNQSVLIN